MTVAADDSLKTFPGNGVSNTFNGPRLFDPAHLSVKLVKDDDLSEIIPTYNLSLVGANGPSLVVLTSPATNPVGYTLQLRRTVPFSQDANFTNQQTLLRRVVEATFDVVVMMIQQLVEQLGRSLHLGSTVVGVSTELPPPSPLSPLVWNAAGDGLENGSNVMTGDLLLRGNLAAAAGATLVGFQPPAAGTLAQTIAAALSNGVPVTWFESIGGSPSLAVDATAAVQAAISYAYSSGRQTVYFPGGKTYRFAAASASIDPGTADITFYGDGPDSVLKFEEGSTGGSILDRKNLFRNTDDVAKGSITFRNLSFVGTWSEAGYPAGVGGATMLLDYYDEIVIDSCRFTNLRSYVMANEFIKNARVINCTFDKNARDNCRFRSSFNVQVIGNRFSHCDDDAVALHCNIGATGGDIREGIVVADNIFEDCPGMQILGGRMVTVRGNILRRCKQNGILIYTSLSAANEGDNGMFGVSVTDNQIFDMLNDSPFSTPVAGVIAVYSRAAEGGSSTSGLIPGTNNVATGNFVLPWNHRNTAYSGTVDSVAPPFFVRIQNNTICRTLPAVATYSLWGYGSCFAGDGPQNPAVVDASQRPGTGIILGGQVRKAIVSGNVVSHVGTCLGFDAEAGSNFGLDDILVANNVFSDFNSACIAIPNPGAARHVNLDIRHNLIDGDPYHISSNRGAGGTWAADTTPTVINNTSHQGVRLEQNKIRNVARIVNNGGGSLVAVRDNVLRCDPAATGFSTSNKGIGNCPRADDAYRYEITDSDPTSATYGNITGSIQMFSAAMPATGKYVVGTFIRAASGTTLLGWQRLTTGTAHVAGTDWKTVVLT